MLVWAAAGASAEIRSPDGNPHSRFRFTFEDPPVVLAATPRPILPVQAPPPDRERRPPALVPLYLGFGALQGLDVHATTRAIDRGAGELNPLLRGIAGNPLALAAAKAAGSAAVICASERLWKKKKRKSAIAVMIAVNAATLVAVQHNYRVSAR
jgi:hypothetical protein